MDERSETNEPNGWANEFWILNNEMMKVHNILYPATLSGLATTYSFNVHFDNSFNLLMNNRQCGFLYLEIFF